MTTTRKSSPASACADDRGVHVRQARRRCRCFFADFAIDNETGEGVCITNPLLRPLFEDITHLDIEQRRALGQDQLAKALHALLASHAEWRPMRVNTLMQRLGAHYERLRDFKPDLKGTLENFVVRGWIRGFAFHAGGRGIELIAINKIPSRSQQLAIDAKQASG